MVVAIVAGGAIGAIAWLLRDPQVGAMTSSRHWSTSSRESATVPEAAALPSVAAAATAATATKEDIHPVREVDVAPHREALLDEVRAHERATVVARVATHRGIPFTDGHVRVQPATLELRALNTFERHPRGVGWGTSACLVEPLDANGEARITEVPLGIRCWVSVMHGEERVDRVTIEPLGEGETREIRFTIEGRLYVPFTVTRASDGTLVDLPSGLDFYRGLTWTWTGAPNDVGIESAESLISLKVSHHELTLPGPGHLVVRLAMRGFEPFEESMEVDAGSRLQFRLVARRTLDLDVVDQHGREFEQRWDDWQEYGPGIQFTGGGGACFSPAFELGAWSADRSRPPPLAEAVAHFAGANYQDAHSRRAKTDGPLTSRSRWRLHLSDVDMVVGAFLDGELAGTVHVPREAASATLAIYAPPPQTGSLVFETIDAETGLPVSTFDVYIDDRGAIRAGSTLSLRFERPGSGRFEMPRLRAGRYAMTVNWWRTDATNLDVAFEIRPGERTDLGTIACTPHGDVEIEVVDEDGHAVPGATYLVLFEAEDDDLAALTDEPWTRSTGFTDTNGVSTLQIESGTYGFAARAAGFELATAIVKVAARKQNSVRLTLRPK